MKNSISLFGVALEGSTSQDLFRKVNECAMKNGYLVVPECCTQEVYDYFRGLSFNPNSTFYKTWDEVRSLSRIELFFHQIRHYMSTYGSGFEEPAWVPNEKPEVVDYTKYTIIKAISINDLFDRCVEMLKSPINLDGETVEFLVNTTAPTMNTASIEQKYEFIESVHSREAQAKFYKFLGITPREKFALLRWIAEVVTDNPMIIQNEEGLRKIKLNANKFDLSKLSEEQVVALSSIFLRYKNFFCMLKSYKKNAPVVNKMRRLAVKTHTPMKLGFWESILAEKPALSVVQKRLDEVSPFKLVQLVNTIRERLVCAPKRGFLIRNQKYYYKDNNLVPDEEYYKALEMLIVWHLKVKYSDVRVKLPKDFSLACPTGEKNFIGNYPFGSQILLSNNNAFIGIYWKNSWGTNDFDLSYLNEEGNKIGWNSAYYDESQNIVFSGDMTNADPEAAEILWFKSTVPDGVILVNRYRGREGSRFDLFFGKEEIDQRRFKDRNHPEGMVDPNNILTRVECISDQKETSVAFVSNGTVTLMNVRTGNQPVSTGTGIIDIMKAKSFLKIEEVFSPADEDTPEVVDLSKDLSRDSLIKLFS